MQQFLDNLMGQIVYILCALTSLGCTILLFGRYRKSRADLLFWSAVAFLAFTLTNVLLYIDLVVVPDVDFAILRNSVTLIGVLTLLFGLIRNNT
jgi:hypothetical protein